MLYALILNYNDYKTTEKCIKNLSEIKIIKKIIVVDNNSTDNSYQNLKNQENKKIIIIKNNENKGYGAGNNFGINYIMSEYHPKYILLSNPDVIVNENTVNKMVTFLDKHRDYSMVAPFMKNSFGVKQYNTAFKIPSKWNFILSYFYIIRKYSNSIFYKDIFNVNTDFKKVDALSGSMFLMRAKDMISYGMFDENIFLYWEELCIALKMRKAKRKLALLVNHSFVHNHSVTINKIYNKEINKYKIQMISKKYILKKYYKINKMEEILAFILEKISVIEMMLICKIKKI